MRYISTAINFMPRRADRIGILLASILIVTVSITGCTKAAPENDVAVQAPAKTELVLQEELAYHTGVLAYIYGYPLVHMQQGMHNDTHRINPDQSRYAPVNRFSLSESLVTPETAGTLRAPNADTLYFAGWFDLREEPVILHNPDTHGRYFTMAVTNQWAEVIHLGRRTIGTDEQYHALIGPGWDGKLPEGVKPVQLDTDIVWVLGRLLIDGKSDEPEAQKLLGQFWASPLSTWERGKPLSKASEISGEPMSSLSSLDYFTLMNKALRANPRRPDEAALMSQFNSIGIGPDVIFDVDELDPDIKAGLERAIVAARKMIAARGSAKVPMVNRWKISRDIGRYGHNYMMRAATVAGGYGNLPEESLYAATLFDQHSTMLSGDKSYHIRFEADQLPPVNGFWSFAAYNIQAHNFEKNTIQRYGIGDRTPDLQYGEDGSLTLYFQHDKPDEGPSNWLPVPKTGFYVILRLYEPQEALLGSRYEIPPLVASD